VLMFLDTKHAVDQFTRHLRSSGVRAGALHSGKSQPQRTHTLAQFRDGQITVLVATNVAARGIHVEQLDLVVNVDPPADPKDYLHRGGRTARAGESGRVVTLVTPGERRDVNRMMSDAGIRPTVTQVRSGEAALTSITGAKRPPVREAAKTGSAPFRGLGARAGRPPKESRKAAEAALWRRRARQPVCARPTDTERQGAPMASRVHQPRENAEFEFILARSDVPVLAYFHGTWPKAVAVCKEMDPLVREVADAYQGRLIVVRADIARCPGRYRGTASPARPRSC
jgi:Superfamily II DNA and RNA helicases